MESPISGTIAEIFLQHIRNTHMKQLLDTKNTVYCTRYIDDIVLIYDTKYINSDIIHEYINKIHSNLQMNPTYENNGRISFLDLLVIRNSSNLEKDIYRKPTTTNTIINFISNHPSEHKLAAYNILSPECKLTINNRKTTDRMEDTKIYSTKQQLP
jgi:DNA-binding GntR family transcriptional regulator